MTAIINITPIFWSVIRIIPNIPRNNLSKLLNLKRTFALDEGFICNSSPQGSYIMYNNFKDLIVAVKTYYVNSNITNKNCSDINEVIKIIQDYEDNTDCTNNPEIDVIDLEKMFNSFTL